MATPVGGAAFDVRGLDAGAPYLFLMLGGIYRTVYRGFNFQVRIQTVEHLEGRGDFSGGGSYVFFRRHHSLATALDISINSSTVWPVEAASASRSASPKFGLPPSL
jgi:hypothetical protein